MHFVYSEKTEGTFSLHEKPRRLTMSRINSLNECRLTLENLAESSQKSMILLKSTMEKLGVLMATIKDAQRIDA
jgi:hypothetical protein